MTQRRNELANASSHCLVIPESMHFFHISNQAAEKRVVYCVQEAALQASVFIFILSIEYCCDALIVCFFHNEHAYFPVDLTDVSAHTKTLVQASASFLAETSVPSPRKIFNFIIYKKYFLDQSIQKICDLSLKTEALVQAQRGKRGTGSDEL